MGGVSAAVSKTAAAPIERVKLMIQNQVRFESLAGLLTLSFELSGATYRPGGTGPAAFGPSTRINC